MSRWRRGGVQRERREKRGTRSCRSSMREIVSKRSNVRPQSRDLPKWCVNPLNAGLSVGLARGLMNLKEKRHKTLSITSTTEQ